MYIEIIKDHVSGLKKGLHVNCGEGVGNRLIDQGHAKESNEDDYNSYVKKRSDLAIEKALALHKAPEKTEPTSEELKELHFKMLSEKSDDQLKKYLTSKKLTIEVDKGDSKEDIVTKIIIAEESKKKGE